MSPVLIKTATEFAANPSYVTHRNFIYMMNRVQWKMTEEEAKAGAALWAARCQHKDGNFRDVFEADLAAARIYSEM